MQNGRRHCLSLTPHLDEGCLKERRFVKSLSHLSAVAFSNGIGTKILTFDLMLFVSIQLIIMKKIW